MAPRISKRKAPKRSSSIPPHKIPHLDSVHSASSNAASKKIDFKTYADSSSDMIEPEGIEKLCSDLKLETSDVKVLMLAWKMKAKKQGYFTKDEWKRGMEALNVDTITKLKKSLPGLEEDVLKPENFEDFYSYAFRYNLTEFYQKGVTIETACILLDIVLGSQFQLQVDLFKEFLQVQTEYKVLNMDQWMNFYRFCKEITFPDLVDYDDREAWPAILDDFVDWLKEKIP
ncbi:ubiquitin-protein ligase [Lithospermum erythrorhizon]|uniref:Defective in cullin neddylation protein n=1 Tax=Lithospermum erythrorhizon TaxID=34254 RepID=A0AAV3Q0X4_LITER